MVEYPKFGTDLPNCTESIERKFNESKSHSTHLSASMIRLLSFQVHNTQTLLYHLFCVIHWVESIFNGIIR